MTLSSDLVAKLIADPKYQELVSKRNRINNTFFLIALVIYAGFIFLVAFANNLMEQPLGDMTISIGLVLGTWCYLALACSLSFIQLFVIKQLTPPLKSFLRRFSNA
jgi:uncharacterized membrane protein (DUF485 family)